MPRTKEKIIWRAPEYEHSKKPLDWFWAVAIIGISATITAILFKNYLFALFIFLSSVFLLFFSTRKPEGVELELNERGLRVEDILYPYEKIESFWIKRSKNKPPKLLLHINRTFTPILIASLENISEKDVEEILKKNQVPQKLIEEPLSHKIMEYFGF